MPGKQKGVVVSMYTKSYRVVSFFRYSVYIIMEGLLDCIDIFNESGKCV